MKAKLARLEARLQSLVEGGAARLFPFKGRQQDPLSLLLEAMRDHLKDGLDGQLIGPNLYQLHVHPTQAPYFSQNQALMDSLIQSLYEAGEEAHLTFTTPPVLRLVEDDSLEPGELRAAALHSQEHLTQTTDVAVESEGEAIPPNAFLIVDGTQTFTLTQAVINIGRRPDNQLVIDDPRISRLHAQLRAVHGRFVVFDLNSTGGTFVNGEPVTQCTLQAGDVISLAGLPLVFGQEGLTDTQDLKPFEQGDLPPLDEVP